MIQGFTKATTKILSRLILSVAGQEKQGKSSLALSAPGPIIYFNLDFGLEGVVHKHASTKAIYVKHYTIKRGDSQALYADAWTALKRDYYNALKSTARTVVLDTSTEVWELLRLARFGKLSQVMPHQYGPVNAEFVQMIREAHGYDKNLILLHKMKREYVNDHATGRYERAGYSGVGYLVQANVVVYRDGMDWGFFIRVMDCRQNAMIGGMECPLPDEFSGFSMLAQWVFPDTSEEEWR